MGVSEVWLDACVDGFEVFDENGQKPKENMNGVRRRSAVLKKTRLTRIKDEKSVNPYAKHDAEEVY